jgi:PAS domain-containing protein
MKRLLHSVETLQQVLHGVANGITVQDPSGKLVFVNEAAARMMDCDSPEGALAKGGQEIIADYTFFDEQGKPFDTMRLPGRLALQGIAEPEIIVSFYSQKDPRRRWATIKALPVLENGQVILSVSVIQDITQLKETEARLKEANDRVTKLLSDALL